MVVHPGKETFDCRGRNLGTRFDEIFAPAARGQPKPVFRRYVDFAMLP
jgi:hypothetical protein